MNNYQVSNTNVYSYLPHKPACQAVLQQEGKVGQRSKNQILIFCTLYIQTDTDHQKFQENCKKKIKNQMNSNIPVTPVALQLYMYYMQLHFSHRTEKINETLTSVSCT